MDPRNRAASPSTSPSPSTPPSFVLDATHRGWVLADGTIKAEAAQFALGAAPEALASCLGDALLPEGRFELSINALFLEWGPERILIDTGCGPAFGPTLGKIPEQLAAAGCPPESITTVIFTHLHLDHIGGALDDRRSELRYPNARLLAPRAEVAFWSQPEPDLSLSAAPVERRAAMLRGTQHAIGVFGSALLTFEPGDTLFEGLTVLGLPGHTPGHCGFRLAAGGSEVWAIGDTLTDARIACAFPRFNQSGDVIPSQAVASRLALLERASEGSTPLFGCHFKPPGLLRIRRKGDTRADGGYTWQPVDGAE